MRPYCYRSNEEVTMKKDKKKNETWGQVTPGPRTEGESSALRPMEDNAALDNMHSPNMDPESAEGGEENETDGDRKEDWQQLNKTEMDLAKSRKNGSPKNTGTNKGARK